MRFAAWVLLVGCVKAPPQPFQFAVLGDRTDEPTQAAWEDVVKDVRGLRPDLVLTVGDLVDDWRDPVDWELALLAREWLAPVPLYLTPGNHDIEDVESARLFTERTGFEPYYSFDREGVHFVIVDNSVAESYEQLPQAQRDWLTADLQKNASKLTLVLMHKPFWGSFRARGKPDPLHELFVANGVDAVFTGHWHRYAHEKIDGIEYYIAGTSGGAVWPNIQDYRIGTAYQFLWGVVEDGKLSVRTVESSGVHEQDGLEANDASALFAERGALRAIADVERGNVRVEADNRRDVPMDLHGTVSTLGGWKSDVPRVDLMVPPKETAVVDLPLQRTGEWFPLPVLSVEYPLPSGRTAPMHQPVDVLRPVKVPAAAAPVIDGDLTDPTWTTAVRLTEFGDAQGQRASGDPTEVWMVADETTMYVAAICQESHMETLKHQYTERDGHSVYDDRIGMLLSPDSNHTYWFYVNPNGAIWDLSVQLDPRVSDLAWNGNFRVATKIGTDRWVVELAVPLSELAKTEAPEWRFNVRRMQPRRTKEALWAPAWDAARPQRMAPLMFVR